MRDDGEGSPGLSLIGDVMAHAFLPGAALGSLAAALSLGAMAPGGLAAGLLVALLSGAAARATALREDATLAAFQLISLALGVMLVSMRGGAVDLMHVLFGAVLALDDQALVLLCAIATVTLVALAVVLRPLVLECVDPDILRSVGGPSAGVHFLFLTLAVLNLSAPFTRSARRRPWRRRQLLAQRGSCCRSISACLRDRRSSSSQASPWSFRCCSARSAACRPPDAFRHLQALNGDLPVLSRRLLLSAALALAPPAALAEPPLMVAASFNTLSDMVARSAATASR